MAIGKTPLILCGLIVAMETKGSIMQCCCSIGTSKWLCVHN